MQAKKNGGVSFWYENIGGTPGYRAPLPGDIEVDICIVGAGSKLQVAAGLSALSSTLAAVLLTAALTLR